MKSLKRNTNKVIAIDFDGTITEDSPYPKMGAIRESAKKYIKLLHDNGYTLLLWTARKGSYFSECVNTLNSVGLLKYFTMPLISVMNVGKVNADYYIDDRSIPGKINWKKTYKYIIKNI